MDVKRSNPDQYQLRFPVGMRDRIKKAAQVSGQSMNAEIIERLENSFEFERKEYRYRAEIAEINQQTENAHQEYLDALEKLKYRENREIELLAEIRQLRTRILKNNQGQRNEAEIAALRSELGEIHQMLQRLSARLSGEKKQ